MHASPDDARRLPVVPRPAWRAMALAALLHLLLAVLLLRLWLAPETGASEAFSVQLVAASPMAIAPAAASARVAMPAHMAPPPARPAASVADADMAPASVPAAMSQATDTTRAVAEPAPVSSSGQSSAPAQPLPSAVAPALPASSPRTAAGFLRQPLPTYPDDLRRRGIEGSVLLRVAIDEQGRPTHVVVDRSSGYEQFDHSAVSTVQQQYRFRPAYEGQRAVSSEVRFTVPFRLAE